MDREAQFLELEDTFSNLLEGMNALELMIQGLAQVQDPYAKGFCTFYVHFKETVTQLQKLLEQLSAAKT